MPKAYGYCRLSKDEVTAKCSACQAEWALKITNVDDVDFDCPYCGHTYHWDRKNPISIQAQVDKCHYLADHHVPRAVDPDIQIFVDLNVSRSVPIWERPQGEKLFNALRNDDWLIVPILDRAFGDTEDCANKLKYFLKEKIHVVIGEFPGVDIQTPMGRMMIQMAAIFAELERTKIASRTKAGLQMRKRLGKPVNGHPPKGYQQVCTECGHKYSHPESRKGKTCPACKTIRRGTIEYMPDPNEQRVMWRILWHRTAYAWMEWDLIAHSLNEEGYRSREGKKLTINWCNKYYRAALLLLWKGKLLEEHKPIGMHHLSLDKIPHIPKEILEEMERERHKKDKPDEPDKEI